MGAPNTRFVSTNLQKHHGQASNHNSYTHNSLNNSCLHQPSQNSTNANGNIMNSQTNSLFHGKKGDNNYQKLNKQSTMLYLHHHPAHPTGVVPLNHPEAPDFKPSSNSFMVGKIIAELPRQNTLNPLKEINYYEKENVINAKYEQISSQPNVMNISSTNNQRRSKMAEKGNIVRRSSQEKQFTTINGYYAQENHHKNRPQTSFRLATKNTF
mmetsp:Transcript_42325/g.40559  ORF Transcript_42325/g.40559 Transcript_42325/m.40559 type:complete len:211 (+) Transcript_42325:73-705(+)